MWKKLVQILVANFEIIFDSQVNHQGGEINLPSGSLQWKKLILQHI